MTQYCLHLHLETLSTFENVCKASYAVWCLFYGLSPPVSKKGLTLLHCSRALFCHVFTISCIWKDGNKGNYPFLCFLCSVCLINGYHHLIAAIYVISEQVRNNLMLITQYAESHCCTLLLLYCLVILLGGAYRERNTITTGKHMKAFIKFF